MQGYWDGGKLADNTMHSIHYTVLCKRQSIILHHCCIQEEVQKLQAEVAQLDAKLAEVNQVLATATVAREDERYRTENAPCFWFH